MYPREHRGARMICFKGLSSHWLASFIQRMTVFMLVPERMLGNMKICS